MVVIIMIVIIMIIMIVIIVLQLQVDSGTLVLRHFGLDVTVRSLVVSVVELTDDAEMGRVVRVLVRDESHLTAGEVVAAVHLYFLSDLVSFIILVVGCDECCDEDSSLEVLVPLCAEDVDGQRMIFSHKTTRPVRHTSQYVTGLDRGCVADFIGFIVFVVTVIVSITYQQIMDALLA